MFLYSEFWGLYIPGSIWPDDKPVKNNSEQIRSVGRRYYFRDGNSGALVVDDWFGPAVHYSSNKRLVWLFLNGNIGKFPDWKG
jgi:hypothetical protein